MQDSWRAAWLVVVVCVLASLPRAREPLAPCPSPGLVEDEPVPVVACDRPDAPPLEGAARRLFELPLDLNRASPQALETLPGIGPSRAAAIVSGRPYATVGELRRISGIGPVLLARIRPFVSVGGSVAEPKAGFPENR